MGGQVCILNIHSYEFNCLLLVLNFVFSCFRCFDSGVYSGVCSSGLAPKLATLLGLEADQLIVYTVYQPHDLKLLNEHRNVDKVTKSVGEFDAKLWVVFIAFIFLKHLWYSFFFSGTQRLYNKLLSGYQRSVKKMVASLLPKATEHSIPLFCHVFRSTPPQGQEPSKWQNRYVTGTNVCYTGTNANINRTNA